MLFKVYMTVDGIQTETRAETQAKAIVLEDAQEFYGDWTYEAYAVEPYDPSEDGMDPNDLDEGRFLETSDVIDMNFAVESMGRSKGVWTFEATAEVVVDAPDAEMAKTLAVLRPHAIRYGTEPAPVVQAPTP